MRPEILITDIVEKVKGEFIHKGNKSYVRWIVSSGLMSDILTTEEEEILLLSSLNTSQIVRTADMVGANAVMIACGKPIPNDTVELARELDITLIRTEFPIFETCYYLAKIFDMEKK